MRVYVITQERDGKVIISECRGLMVYKTVEEAKEKVCRGEKVMAGELKLGEEVK